MLWNVLPETCPLGLHHGSDVRWPRGSCSNGPGQAWGGGGRHVPVEKVGEASTFLQVHTSRGQARGPRLAVSSGLPAPSGSPRGRVKSLGDEAILLGMNGEFFFLRQRNTSLHWPFVPGN